VSVAQQVGGTKTSVRKNIIAARLVLECWSCGDEQGGFANDWDADFVQSLTDQARRFGDKLWLSDKQWNQLFRIAEDLGVEL
jgi:hypothetical protein